MRKHFPGGKKEVPQSFRDGKLFKALAGNNRHQAEYALQRGANIYAVNKDGICVAEFALRNCNAPMTRWILSMKPLPAQLTAEGWTMLNLAMKKNNIAAEEVLVKQPDMLRARNGSYEELPLFFAIRENCEAAICRHHKIFDLNELDAAIDKTPMMHAISLGRTSLAMLLQRLGADGMKKNSRGHSAHSMARDKGFTFIATEIEIEMQIRAKKRHEDAIQQKNNINAGLKNPVRLPKRGMR